MVHLRFSTEAESHLPKLTLFTKEECQLCDEAKDQLRPHWHRFQFVEVDITLPENEKWFELYRYEIPVFYLDEKFLCKNRIDLDKLEEKLGEKGV